jgi:hypothetical protein
VIVTLYTPELGVGSDPVDRVANPIESVIVYEVAAGDSSLIVHVTTIAPSLYGRFVPTSVAVTFSGANGSKKSFCWDERPPASFFAMSYSLLTLCCQITVHVP